MTLHLLMTADGPRDEVTVPYLVAGLLGEEVRAEFTSWKDIRVRGGAKGIGALGRKLLFLMRRAKDRGFAGLVATVDRDKDAASHKLSDLRQAREYDRANSKLTPAALGEAIPHVEAWLLDDPVAVRAALGFAPDAEIKSPTKIRSPKDELHALCGKCKTGQSAIELLTQLAKQLAIAHCIHAQQTGFQQFATEVERELRPLCKS